MSLLPESTVSVSPIKRTNPIVEQALGEIMAIIKEDGFADATEFMTVAHKYQMSENILIPGLQQKGVTFVRTEPYATQPVQEVLVDLRYIAAAMLLVYSDNEFALNNSVLDYLRACHTVATWPAAFPVAHHPHLLEDTYGMWGHLFTDMAMANTANIAQGRLTAINAMAERHSHALHELSKSDAELTEVFHLALQTFDLLNNQPVVKPGKLELTQKSRLQLGSNCAYRHFWRVATTKVLSPYRAKRFANIANMELLSKMSIANPQ